MEKNMVLGLIRAVNEEINMIELTAKVAEEGERLIIREHDFFIDRLEIESIGVLLSGGRWSHIGAEIQKGSSWVTTCN